MDRATSVDAGHLEVFARASVDVYGNAMVYTALSSGGMRVWAKH